LLADYNENHVLMLMNCWILDRVCSFLNKTPRWFQYVCIKMWTCKISARFHSLTEMSPDRNGPDRNGADRNGSDRIDQTEKSRTHLHGIFCL